MSLYVVEIWDEDGELVGYGVCAEEGRKFTMRPNVYGTRSEAHAALNKEVER